MTVPSTAAPTPSKNPSLVFLSAWAGAVDRQMNAATAVIIEINCFIFVRSFFHITRYTLLI
jgi:hypothetical protein